jgi:hypothetical protein
MAWGRVRPGVRTAHAEPEHVLVQGLGPDDVRQAVLVPGVGGRREGHGDGEHGGSADHLEGYLHALVPFSFANNPQGRCG